MFCITSLSRLQLKSIEVLFDEVLPVAFLLLLQILSQIISFKIDSMVLLAPSEMEKWDTGTPSCWSSLCYLCMAFFGMQSDFCRFLKARPSSELFFWARTCVGGLSQQFGTANQRTVHWGVLTLAQAKTSLVPQSRLARFLWSKGIQAMSVPSKESQTAACSGVSRTCLLTRKWGEDVEEGTSECFRECVARLLACYCLVFSFIVF